MAVDILMPALSPTMEEGTLAKWLVEEGDAIKSGDILAEIETDKATMEFEAVDEGIIGKLLVAEGTASISVNSPIAILLEEGEEPATIQAKTTVKEPILTTNKKAAELMSALDAPPNESLVEQNLPEGTKYKTKTVREAIREAMSEEMRLDEAVYLIGEEVAEYEGAYKISQGMLDEFGSKRVIDTPITEHGFTGIAVGAAFGGLKPVVEFMTFNFAMQAMDQIINSAAKTLYMSGGQMGAPIVFRGPNGAAARVGAQHSQDYAAWYSHIPGLKVVQPYSAADAKGLLKSAIRDPNPVIFLENEILYGQSFEVPDSVDYTVPLGKARVWYEGNDITLVSFGIGMKYTLEAAEQLEEMGVSVEVIDLRSLRPLDTQTVVNSVKKTNRCVTIEEGYPVCSIGNYVSSVLMQQAFDYLDAPVINCAGKDVPMPYAANLEKLALVTTEDVMDAAKSVLYRQGARNGN
jgi:pyruvate dehydrogenase E1 component beta subunit